MTHAKQNIYKIPGLLAAAVIALQAAAPDLAIESPAEYQVIQRQSETERFEVASVKRCRTEAATLPGERKTGGPDSSSPGRVHLSCQTVMSLVQRAYVSYAQGRFDPMAAIAISGGPAWIDSERYQIDAAAGGPRSEGALNGPMLRALLEERFQLKIRRETREVPVYALTAVKGGLKATQAQAGGCVAFDAEHPPAFEPGKPFPRICGMARVTNDGFDAPGVTMADLCRLLSDYADRKVVDRTGIAGRFDVHLDLSAADLGHKSDSNASDTFAAVKAAVQKIGLKLESAKGAGEFLVIERVERPSEN